MNLRLTLLAAFALLLSLPIASQTCTGNLGENIFTAGDFGSGAANIVTVDPLIAPGFIYQRTPPPNDGFYTITNDMRRWPNTFGGWDAFADNSPDPNGYMMVVNAAFAPGKFYEQQVDDLCENTLYQFTADVRNILRRGNNGLMPNVSFSIDGITRFTSGPIGETQTWNTYGFTFTTDPGQTSVLLALSNNAPGGNGNDLAIDNISFRACGPEARIAGAETLSVCEDGGPATLTAEINGDQYDNPALQWQQSFDDGMTWQDLSGENGMTFDHTGRSSGFYFYRYLLANGDVNLANTKCRVVSNIKTVYVVPKRYEIIDTICTGLTFAVGSSTYSNTGVSLDTLISSLGCDSIVTLRLTVVPDPGIVPTFDLIDPSCSYLNDGSIQLLDVTNGVAPFGYFLDSLSRTIGAVLPGLSEGAYRYRVVDRYGCTASGDVRLMTPNPFQIELGPDQVVSLGESVRLNAGTGDDIMSYVYTPADLVNCTTDCEGVTFFPAENTLLKLLAISPAGCESEDSLRIIVVKDRLVYPPTAFSPNGDGVNDRFTLFAATPNVTALASLRVFDRWGGQVFEGIDLAPNAVGQGWDGQVDTEAAPPGTYTYVAEVVFLDGVVERYSGVVVLVR
ncbi:T9SS C-terminal target domain-containing protein [Neolewinella persica]|uniref:T9SS C-terminal target domain-containing protein n=1 Tax=Neolewinella persica TaxID=70998 RepID=UPI0003714E2B|nr:T9SS C-terminal target domain-containing protein [Neolewinella persica]